VIATTLLSLVGSISCIAIKRRFVSSAARPISGQQLDGNGNNGVGGGGGIPSASSSGNVLSRSSSFATAAFQPTRCVYPAAAALDEEHGIRHNAVKPSSTPGTSPKTSALHAAAAASFSVAFAVNLTPTSIVIHLRRGPTHSVCIYQRGNAVCPQATPHLHVHRSLANSPTRSCHRRPSRSCIATNDQYSCCRRRSRPCTLSTRRVFMCCSRTFRKRDCCRT